MIVKKVDPLVAKILIDSRASAMHGKLPETMQCLLEGQVKEKAAERPGEALTAAMLRAEMLHLDDQDAESAHVFTSELVPLLADVPREPRFIVVTTLTSV